ncbi:hypothetical protein CYMTET_8600 [Cymbomonas tetramitiformis]|uniref:Uncharacterized protein n=1 Tax=Cymbomonas tetramitiformis TaxID=36881 RepID=A0AAE0GT77_9CHLO|nr:hypothetical protein CYMTET_8600 [Cymbomonas tetramitiformis]
MGVFNVDDEVAVDRDFEQEYFNLAVIADGDRAELDVTRSELLECQDEVALLKQRLRDASREQRNLASQVKALQGRLAGSAPAPPPTHNSYSRPLSAPLGKRNVIVAPGRIRPGSAAPQDTSLSLQRPPSALSAGTPSRPQSGRRGPDLEPPLGRHRPTSALAISAKSEAAGRAQWNAQKSGVAASSSTQGVEGEDWVAATGPSTTSRTTPASVAGSLGYKDVAVQVAATNWTRFYFRNELNATNMKKANDFYQYFDVVEREPLSPGEMVSTHRILEELAPEWLPESYSRLYYSRHREGTELGKISFRCSKEITKSGDLFAKEPEKVLVMEEFVNFVARLLPRSNLDYECLRELQSGLLLHCSESSKKSKANLIAQVRETLREDFTAEMTKLRTSLLEEMAHAQDANKRKETLNSCLSKMQRSVHNQWGQRMKAQNEGMNAEMERLLCEMVHLNDTIRSLQDALAKAELEAQRKYDDKCEEKRLVDEEAAALRVQYDSLVADHAKESEELNNKVKRQATQIAELESNLSQLKAEYEMYKEQADSWMREQQDTAANTKKAYESQVKSMNESMTKLNVTGTWKLTSSRLKSEGNAEALSQMEEKMKSIESELLTTQHTGFWAKTALKTNLASALSDLGKLKADTNAETEKMRLESAEREAALRAALEQKDLDVEKGAKLKADLEDELARMKKEEDEKNEILQQMESSLEDIQARLDTTLKAEEDANLARSNLEKTMQVQSAKEKSEYDNMYLVQLFGSNGMLSKKMDNGDFVSMCHGYFGYMAANYKVEAMVCALAYDPEKDDDGEDDPDTFDDNVFKVMAVTPGLSSAGLVHFQDAGTFLPQDPTTLHYKACNLGKAQEMRDQRYGVKLVCIPLIIGKEVTVTMGATPSYGTLMFLVPGEVEGDEKLMKLVETDMRGGAYNGKDGLGKAATQLMLSEMQAAQAVVETPHHVPADDHAQAYNKMVLKKVELESALLKTTLNKALTELKRYRRPTDTVIAIVMGVLLLVHDEHVMQFRELFDFALGPRGENQMSSIWLVSRNKLISGSKHGSLINLMRALELSDFYLASAAYAQLDPEEKEGVQMTQRLGTQIIATFDKEKTKKASQVLYMLREWMIVITDMNTMVISGKYELPPSMA